MDNLIKQKQVAIRVATGQADVLLVTVTKVEAKAVFAALGQEPNAIKQYRGDKTYYDFGEIGGARVVMVRSEMGSAGLNGSTLVVDEAIRVWKPWAVIMVGIAFGVDPDKQRIGDVLVARQLQLYGLQKVAMDKGGAKNIILRGDKPAASPVLLDRFRGAELEWDEAHIKFGLVLTGDKLVDNIDYRDQLCDLAPEAIGGEMEGSGLYAAAQNKKVDWILVKAICDFADGHKSENKDANQQKAAANSVGLVAHVLGQGGLNPVTVRAVQ